MSKSEVKWCVSRVGEHNKSTGIKFYITLNSDLEDKLRYISVKPTASISVLRQKVWHLLDLPDYCEEMIILKSGDKELPLTELRRGNNPHHPYILDVWMPESRLPSSTRNNMLTLGNSETDTSERIAEKQDGNLNDNDNANSAISNETIALKYRFPENSCKNIISSEFKKSDLLCRMSSTSLFKLNGKKNRDSFTNILLKIQSDLCTLSSKLSNLENRIPL